MTTPCPKCDQVHDPTKCTGHNARGLPCGNRPIRGGTVCSTHGGSAPQVRAAAEQRVTDEEAGKVLAKLWDADAEPITDPVGAMAQLAGRLQHVADEVGRLLEDGDLDGPRERAWIRAVRELRQLLDAMARLGIAEKHVQLEQERAQLVTAAFLAALEVGQLLPEVRSLMTERFLDGLGTVVVAGEVVA